MSCRLVQNITHSCDYNAGGITNIYLLDIRDFISYTFSDDRLYDACYVDKINTSSSFVEIGAVNESSFIETNENGIYKQDLTTFIHTLNSEKLADILLAASNKHLVAFRTSQGKMYCFGSDGGVSLSFSQVTGQMGEVAGYSITISKNSVFPLFEINIRRFNTISVLATEELRVAMTEDQKNALLILSNDNKDTDNTILSDAYQTGKEDSIFTSIPTDQELDYKLYIDDTEDKVLMLNEDTVTSLIELPSGLERGIALRYTNRQHRQILKPWSEIKSEAENIRTSIIITNLQ